MKRVLCLLVLLFAATSFAGEFQGVVVGTNPTGNIVCYDFSDKSSANLTWDLDIDFNKTPFVISQNGQVIVWQKDSRLWIKRGSNPPSALKLYKTKLGGPTKNNILVIGEEEVDIPENIHNLGVSPDGKYLWFSYKGTDLNWSLVPQKKQIGNLPLVKATPDMFEGVMLVELTIYGTSMNFAGVRKYGHTASTPPANSYMTDAQSFFASMGYMPSTTPFATVIGSNSAPQGSVDRGLTFPWKEYFARFSQKWDAHLCAVAGRTIYSNTEFAVRVNRTINGNYQHYSAVLNRVANAPFLGPIELHRLECIQPKHVLGLDYIKKQKPNVFVIPARFESCDWMDFAPDGSICCLCNKTLYCFSADEIKAGIEKSSLRLNPDSKEGDLMAVNNVLNIQPKVIAQGIEAKKIFWSPKFAYLYKNAQQELICQGQEAEKLLNKTPENFFVCWEKPCCTIKLDKTADPCLISAGNGRAPDYMFGHIGFDNNKLPFFTVGDVNFYIDIQNSNHGKISFLRKKMKVEMACLEKSTNVMSVDPRQIKYTQVKTTRDKEVLEFGWTYVLKFEDGKCVVLKFTKAHPMFAPEEFKIYQDYELAQQKGPKPATSVFFPYNEASYNFAYWDFSPQKVANNKEKVVSSR